MYQDRAVAGPMSYGWVSRRPNSSRNLRDSDEGSRCGRSWLHRSRSRSLPAQPGTTSNPWQKWISRELAGHGGFMMPSPEAHAGDHGAGLLSGLGTPAFISATAGLRRYLPRNPGQQCQLRPWVGIFCGRAGAGRQGYQATERTRRRGFVRHHHSTRSRRRRGA
jgi:hypothetical protein